MKNILTFEDYKNLNIKQVESLIYHQFIDEDINNKTEVSEGFIRRSINKSAGKLFIQNALADEIKRGKELEKSIKEALDGLNAGVDSIKKQIDTNDKDSANQKMDAIKKIKESIKAVQSQAFDTLTMIGSGGEIDFAGFLGSASVIAATRFGILLTPITSTFIIRKAYKYFLGIIKQTIRRNLLIIQLNFDQFENLILQKSFETDNDSETATMSETLNSIILAMQRELIGKDSKLKFTGKRGEEMRKYLANFKETQNALIKQHKEDTRNNPLSSLWQDQHNNTYTRTLEQIKQYINDDSQKELDALKNSITKMAGNDVDLSSFGELMISAAEEYAIKTNHGINNNFIKMSIVFNLENQKKLIEIIKDTQDENLKELEKSQDRERYDKQKEELENDIKTGKELYEKKLKDSTEDYTLDSFEEKFGDDIKYLSAFFTSEDGKDVYEDLKEKNPLIKYAINDIKELNEFLDSINTLRVVEVESVKEFSDSIIHKDQSLYYMMADRSIKDAIKSEKSEPYFGFKEVESKTSKEIEDNINSILKQNIFPTYKASAKNNKKRYFLNFTGDGVDLFNILHNDFKTEIFNKSDNEYIDNISTENKENILKLIYKNFKIGKGVITKFAEYLVRLEANMLLVKKDPYFVAKNNETLIKDCFDPKSKEIQNKNAFVEISSNDYEDIKRFLSTYHQLYDNDFGQEDDTKEKEKK